MSTQNRVVICAVFIFFTYNSISQATSASHDLLVERLSSPSPVFVNACRGKFLFNNSILFLVSGLNFIEVFEIESKSDRTNVALLGGAFLQGDQSDIHINESGGGIRFSVMAGLVLESGKAEPFFLLENRNIEGLLLIPVERDCPELSF
jgi:hypothetical protein